MKERKQWRESFLKSGLLQTAVFGFLGGFLSSIIAVFFPAIQNKVTKFVFSPTCSLMYGQSISSVALVADRLNYYVLGCRLLTLFEEEA